MLYRMYPRLRMMDLWSNIFFFDKYLVQHINTKFLELSEKELLGMSKGSAKLGERKNIYIRSFYSYFVNK